uniref:R3H domain-containing protein n=1 Tax=Chromera velia CCMP2878 TaxID=1169474 RepID=A0A0G4I033_9ALVE|eukprot:Cvel_9850.t1-p1 / transcript=Cvel_9850.t1 / gene=Cvel_9850 / organism=Chromera_velia_CCMP2878 / gene_product=hypothetical protein / transcript_product=hypothetical protein / location=Cvel_scaffold580:7545-11545(+) / protein_length=902 / sequence_SO=supercontig / SO=protein_coding / is_pseudo=false
MSTLNEEKGDDALPQSKKSGMAAFEWDSLPLSLDEFLLRSTGTEPEEFQPLYLQGEISCPSLEEYKLEAPKGALNATANVDGGMKPQMQRFLALADAVFDHAISVSKERTVQIRIKFPPSLPKWYRLNLHHFAEARKLAHYSVGMEPDRYLVVDIPSLARVAPKETETTRDSSDRGTEKEGGEAAQGGTGGQTQSGVQTSSGDAEAEIWEDGFRVLLFRRVLRLLGLVLSREERMKRSAGHSHQQQPPNLVQQSNGDGYRKGSPRGPGDRLERDKGEGGAATDALPQTLSTPTPPPPPVVLQQTKSNPQNIPGSEGSPVPDLSPSVLCFIKEGEKAEEAAARLGPHVYFCTSCELWQNGYGQMQQHVAGKRHKKAEAATAAVKAAAAVVGSGSAAPPAVPSLSSAPDPSPPVEPSTKAATPRERESRPEGLTEKDEEVPQQPHTDVKADLPSKVEDADPQKADAEGQVGEAPKEGGEKTESVPENEGRMDSDGQIAVSDGKTAAPDGSQHTPESDEQKAAEPGEPLTTRAVCHRVTMRRVLIFPGDEVAFQGQPLSPPLCETAKVFLFWKPSDMVTTLLKREHEENPAIRGQTGLFRVTQKLSGREDGGGLTHVGRLDKDTTGLLLLCDDGALVYELMQPNHLQKTYICTVASPPTEEQKAQLLRGVELSDGPVQAEAVEVIALEDLPKNHLDGAKISAPVGKRTEETEQDQEGGGDSGERGEREKEGVDENAESLKVQENTKKEMDNCPEAEDADKLTNIDPATTTEGEGETDYRKLCIVKVRIHSGRTHIVRRLMAHVGLPVLQLHRQAFGPIDLYDPSFGLEKPGDAALLSEATVRMLWTALGGRMRVWLRRAWRWREWLRKGQGTQWERERMEAWLKSAEESAAVRGFFEEMDALSRH